MNEHNFEKTSQIRKTLILFLNVWEFIRAHWSIGLLISYLEWLNLGFRLQKDWFLIHTQFPHLFLTVSQGCGSIMDLFFEILLHLLLIDPRNWAHYFVFLYDINLLAMLAFRSRIRIIRWLNRFFTKWDQFLQNIQSISIQ